MDGSADQENFLPLSFEQRQLWYLQQLMPDTACGSEIWTLTIGEQVDAAHLERSLLAFIGRHEIWRTVFRDRSGEPVQVVRERGDCAWAITDLTDLSEEVRGKQLLGLTDDFARQPFDLDSGPLVRALLVRLGDQDYRLFLGVHPMIVDCASLTQVFLPELQGLYRAEACGGSAQLDDVGAQYAEYAIGQRDSQQGPAVMASQVQFWQEYLAGAPTVIDLPTDRRRPRSRTYQSETSRFILGQRLAVDLRELSAREGVGLRETLTAGLGGLLYRYTGQEVLLVGLAESMRARPELRAAMGCFENIRVVRADLSGKPTTGELLSRLRGAEERARDHIGTPFERVVQAVQPERSPDRQPLVQVLLSCDTRRSEAQLGTWVISRAKAGPEAARFDLSFEVDDQAPDLRGRVVYSRDLFEPETITAMIEHWRMFLSGMTSEPSRQISELQLLTPVETERFHQAWNKALPPPPSISVDEAIARQGISDPEAIAVVCDGTQLSYRELNSRSNQLARYLKSFGAGIEVAVGVCLERSVDQVVALLGILRAGAAYVPMDPDAPMERLEFMIRDSGMPVVIAGESLDDKLTGAGPRLLHLDRDGALIRRQSDEAIDEQIASGALAYIIYTSGSTGQPKGVMVERRALAAHCGVMMREYALAPGDRVLQFSQHSFDASLEQIIPTLMTGARLVLRGPDIWSPRELLKVLHSQRITVMNLPPAYWTQAVREWAKRPEVLRGLRLRLAIIGGDRIDGQTVRQWGELGLDGVRLVNAYGPTETIITATLGEVGAERDPITIGRPLAGRRICILDRGGTPVPRGVVGELHIGGDLLARGYLNRPELTTGRFIPDPFADFSGARLYKTGDLARQLPDGRFEYVGREDHQVKIRGYRIELGEVEAALAEHPDVAEAVVVAQGDDADRELVAYVVASGAELLEQRLRSYLDQRLPRYMQPAVIMQMDRLPRLSTGKPDRRSLPAVDRRIRRGRAQYQPAQLMVQEQLVKIWEELLDVSPVGINDNFFDLGGHSLLAAQLLGRIEQLTGQRLRLSTLFEKPTIEQLTRVVRDGSAGAAVGPNVLPVQAEGDRTPFFFLHGDWTGGAFWCFALARHLGPDQPFYVLETYSFTDAESPTLERVARAHIEAIRTAQPSGPYRIGGFCNGGLLAYEMARQLQAEGQQVEFLGLVNPSSPFQSILLRTVCAGLSTIFTVDVRKRADLYLRARHVRRHVYRRVRPSGPRVASDFGKLLAIEPRLARMFPPREALYRDYVAVFDWMVTDYRPGPYRGKTTFFWSREDPSIAQSWGRIIEQSRPSDIDEHSVPGDLMSSVTEHANVIGEVLAGCLSPAEDAAARPG